MAESVPRDRSPLSPAAEPPANTKKRRMKSPAACEVDAPLSEMEQDFQPAKKSKASPIFVYDASYFRLADELEKASVQFTATYVGKALRFKFPSAECYRRAVHVFDDARVEYHSFLLKNEKDSKYVLRGLPGKTVAEDVKRELERQGYKPRHVTQLRLSGRNVALYLVYFSAGEETAMEFPKCTSLRGISVKVETFRGKKGPTQCYRCQRYGHSSAACKHPARCVKCGGAHEAKSCPKTKEDKPVCCNCGGSHVANYRGCSAAKKVKAVMRQPAKTAIPGAAQKQQKVVAKPSGITKPALVRNGVSFAEAAKQQAPAADSKLSIVAMETETSLSTKVSTTTEQGKEKKKKAKPKKKKQRNDKTEPPKKATASAKVDAACGGKEPQLPTQEAKTSAKADVACGGSKKACPPKKATAPVKAGAACGGTTPKPAAQPLQQAKTSTTVDVACSGKVQQGASKDGVHLVKPAVTKLASGKTLMDRLFNGCIENPDALRIWARKYYKELRDAGEDVFARILVFTEAVTSCPVNLCDGP